MRCLIILSCFLLAGCVTDNGAALVTSFGAVPAAFTAQDALEIDLLKDLARKSKELDFISSGRYSCGDPRDKYLADALEEYLMLNERDYSKKLKKNKNYKTLIKALEAQRAKIKILQAFLAYGDAIKAMQSDFDNAKETLTFIKASVDGLKSATVVSTADPVVAGISTALTLAIVAHGVSEQVAVIEFANRVDKDLKGAAKSLESDSVLAALNHEEALAFSYWDACAKERLNYIRDFYPPARYSSVTNRFEGMTQTSVLDFAKEYRQYLLDREAFIARRPGYVGLIDAIIKANSDIMTAGKKDIAPFENQIVSLTTTLAPIAQSLSK